MPRGYAGKWLDVDLTREKIDQISFDEKILSKYIGGRGLAAKVLWDRLGPRWSEIDPLGPENILIILTGPLTAIHPGARVCVSGKSPTCNGIIGSTTSTEFAAEIKCAGFDGVFVTGQANTPVYLLITDGGAELRDASNLWGLTGEEILKQLNTEIIDELSRRHPDVGLWREPGILYVGPGGENRVRNAPVMTKLFHAAGYGGYGAVMGAKQLKAIVAKGRGPLPEVADSENTIRLWRQIHQSLISDDVFRRWGTGYAGYEVGADTSSEPIRNWQEEWHDEKRFGGPRFDTRYWVKRYHADFNCTTSCMSVSCIKTGRWKGDITDLPDYELQAYLGPNLGIFDPGDTIHMSAVIDNLGLSGINTANTMGWAAELYQRGILTKEDLGFELNWGDAAAFTKLAHLIVDRQGMGDILAEGTYRAALRLGKMKGVDLMPYVIHVKGITIGAHGTRSGKDYVKDYDYAASVQAGDHTSTAQMWDWVFCDTAVVCGFAFKKEFLWEFVRAVTGWEITEERWEQELAPRILTIQRAALLEAGPDVFWDPDKDDDNPPRFYEPLPSGPYKGKANDRSAVKRGVKEYYTILGWDERGIPTSERLRELGLEELDQTFEKFRV